MSHLHPCLNKVRYHDQVDIEDAAGILTTHFDYSSSVIQQQQPPLIDTALETPKLGIHYVNLSSNHSIAPRNQLGIEYFPHSSVNSRPLHPTPNPGGEEGLNIRYSSSERRSPGSQPHDPSITQTMEGDQPLTPVSPVESSTARPSNRTRDRREKSSVVIACRQW